MNGAERIRFDMSEATLEEVDEVLTLWELAGSRGSVTDTPEHLRLVIANVPDLFLVAKQNGVIVGTVLGGWDGWRAHLYRLAVHPNHGRRGIAKALVAEIERRLVAKGARRIYALAYSESGVAFWPSVDYERTTDTAFVRTFA